ncbi:MAG: DUF1127 domain-containing protein [Pseudomonadota bacterium]
MDHARTGLAGFGISQWLEHFRAELDDKIAKRRVYRRTVSELRNLSDRDLNDLGLSRAMIKGIALEAAYGK